MNSLDSFLSLGWGNVSAALEIVTPIDFDPVDKGYAPPFRVAFCPPEKASLQARVTELGDVRPAA